MTGTLLRFCATGVGRSLQVAKGYWIAHVDVHNMDGYKGYVAALAQPLASHQGRFLIRAGAFEKKEGSARSRHIVIEFPSYEAALACYNSPEYQRVIALRTPHAVADLIVVEGYDGAQP
jgi:uncharacterized protein (DUF1330 family)